MCGITGVLSNNRRAVIRLMTNALEHRGPDAEGYYEDDCIALGHRRLSIVDLQTGGQPISNESCTLQMICNGEIYNSPELRKKLIAQGHVFKTATDVEVIVHLYEQYGKNCVHHLRGMFAFAIWDKPNRILFLARDHLGQKPILFIQKNGEFLFASEAKALIASGVVSPTVDLDGLWHYVSLRFLPDEYSLFKGIHKLPAASRLTVRDGKVEVERYWDLRFDEKLSGGGKEIADGLDALLRATVHEHLLSDVPVGAFLSGGIDSSTVAAIMTQVLPRPIPSFSIGVKEQKFNELPYARMVAEQYGMQQHERIVEAKLVETLPAMIQHMEEPVDPFAVGVYLVSRLASGHVKVALGGDGGDENFAGYDRYAGQRIVDYYCLLPEWFRRKLMKRLIDRIPESFGYKSYAQKAAWMNEMSFFASGDRYAQSMAFLRFTQDAKRRLFTSVAQAEIEDYDSADKILEYFNSSNIEGLVDKMLYTDLMTRIPEHLLMIVDRMSMAHSLEVRSPLIDVRVVEFAASIPETKKLHGRKLKWILRKVAARYLPRELITRKKQGFGFPIGIWLRGELRGLLGNLFRESRFVANGLFERKYIESILREHMEGRANHELRLWILLNLELWHRMYIEGDSLDAVRDTVSRLLATSA